MMHAHKDLNTNDPDLDCESAAASQVICAINCAVTLIQEQRHVLPVFAAYVPLSADDPCEADCLTNVRVMEEN